jgi:hypothetical protein
VASTDGYEIKGLAYPGRDATFDSNSQLPAGTHNGRTIYYVFGRYPKTPDGPEYPVLDLMMCHGSFLNVYVAPTPFRLVDGVAHSHTLLLPAEHSLSAPFQSVGRLSRREAENLVVGYSFDLRTNDLVARTVRNPHAGREHGFCAWRLKGAPQGAVTMRSESALEPPEEEGEGDV